MTSNEKKRLWLDKGLKKVEKLDFITESAGRTIGQAALQFVLSEPSMISVLPNIYDAPLLDELAPRQRHAALVRKRTPNPARPVRP